MQPFIPAGELFAPSERVVVPAGQSRTVSIRSYDGLSFGIQRMLFDVPNPSAVTVRGIIGGERVVVENVHVAAFAPLFKHRALRNPIVIPDGQTLDLTFSNHSNVDQPVCTLIEGFSEAQLNALRAHREAQGVAWREGAFVWGNTDVAANQDRKRLDVQMRTGGASISRLFVAAHQTVAASPDAAASLVLGISAQGRDVIRVVTPAQLVATLESRDLTPPLRLGPLDNLTLFLTNQSATPAWVSVLAEAIR